MRLLPPKLWYTVPTMANSEYNPAREFVNSSSTITEGLGHQKYASLEEEQLAADLAAKFRDHQTASDKESLFRDFVNENPTITHSLDVDSTGPARYIPSHPDNQGEVTELTLDWTRGSEDTEGLSSITELEMRASRSSLIVLYFEYYANAHQGGQKISSPDELMKQHILMHGDDLPLTGEERQFIDASIHELVQDWSNPHAFRAFFEAIEARKNVIDLEVEDKEGEVVPVSPDALTVSLLLEELESLQELNRIRSIRNGVEEYIARLVNDLREPIPSAFEEFIHTELAAQLQDLAVGEEITSATDTNTSTEHAAIQAKVREIREKVESLQKDPTGLTYVDTDIIPRMRDKYQALISRLPEDLDESQLSEEERVILGYPALHLFYAQYRQLVQRYLNPERAETSTTSGD